MRAFGDICYYIMENRKWTFRFQLLKLCAELRLSIIYSKQLLDSVFVIPRIIKVEVGVIYQPNKNTLSSNCL